MSRPKYVASCSGGKDSVATLLLAAQHNEPLDEAVFSEVMFDQDTSGEVPEHRDFIYDRLKPFCEKELGIKFTILHADKNYDDVFHHVITRGPHKGEVRGFAWAGMCAVNRDCKIPPVRKYNAALSPDTVSYVGIAEDEPKRLARLDGITKVSLLAKYGMTEADAYKRWLIPYGAWRRYDTGVSTNVLAIATGEGNTLTAEKNQPATIMTEDASTLTNSPVTSGGFWARRTVYPVRNPTGSEHITVELEEYEPVLGRRWLRTYYAATGKWSEKWVEISPASPLDQMVSGSSANINDYTGAGLYWLNKTTVTNTPNGGTGMLIVTTSPTGNVIYQTFVSFNTGSGYVATRCYTNRQWYPWDERPAPASYVVQEGTSGAWRYRIWSDGKKECWLSTSIQTDISFVSGSLFCSGIIPYPYPVTFTKEPTAYVGVRSAYAKPIWGIPSTPSSGTSVTKNAYLELVTTTSTASYKGNIYIYACGI